VNETCILEPMSITVAISNFNAKNYLIPLIPQLKEQGFSDIVVLDDASADGSSEWLLEQKDIRAIIGESNLGPTGNRNRILSYQSAAIILFIDADMAIKSSDTAITIERVFQKNPKTAVIGSLILGHTDEPMWHNWGYDIRPKTDAYAEVLNEIALAHWHEPGIMAAVRQAATHRVGHLEPVASRTVDWISEAFFAVRSSVFTKLGGFDTNFRMFHEGPDFCLRARNAGFTVRFEPNIILKHLDQHSGSDKQRAADREASTRYYYKKHFGMSDDTFTKLFTS
jgi:GT2 family glycosyltransferase